MFILAAPDVNWLWNALFGIFSAIDSMIYGLVSVVTQGFFNVSYIEIFSSGTIKDLTARIYVALAVFMIFKLAFSLIQYLVNPDQVSDKQAGMGKLVSRTATAFIMLIGVPILFDEFLFGPSEASPDNTYQAIIARAIPKIILGGSREDDDDKNTELDGNSMGETMAAIAFSAFVRPNEECSGVESLNESTVSHIAESTTKTCSEALKDQNSENNSGDKSIYAYEYQWGMSTIVGLVMLVIMLFFTVDVAIRAIKLGVLRILAPIPIVSYIDPKSAKDGSFNNWLKSLISTYMEMFIKVAVIYIVMFIIIKLTNGGIDMNGLSGLEETYAKVFIILGLLLFTVQATAFIKNIFGIKDQGMGAGLGMLLGGAGALMAGGGIAGVAQAMAGAGIDGAQGKANFGNFNKGKQLAEKTAKGQATAQRRAEKRAAKLGYDDKRMSDLKAAAAAADSEFAAAQANLQANPNDTTALERYADAAKNSKAANKALEDAKEVRKNPALAVAQGKAFTKSGYARALAAAKGASAVRGAGHMASQQARKVGQAVGQAAYQNVAPVRAVTDVVKTAGSIGAGLIQGGILDSEPVKNAQINSSLYEQDRTSGGKYLDDIDKQNRTKDGKYVESRGIQEYASADDNKANFTFPNQQQDNNNGNNNNS